MNTFILRWNPNISSYKMQEHLDMIPHIRKMEFPFHFDWSIYDWHKGHSGELIDKATASRLFDKMIPIIQGTGDMQCDLLKIFMKYGWDIPFVDEVEDS